MLLHTGIFNEFISGSVGIILMNVAGARSVVRRRQAEPLRGYRTIVIPLINRTDFLNVGDVDWIISCDHLLRCDFLYCFYQSNAF